MILTIVVVLMTFNIGFVLGCAWKGYMFSQFQVEKEE